MGQGTVMYEGAPLDIAMHQRYVCTFDIPDGRVFKTTLEGGFSFGTLPNGAKFQLFLGSPTEEAVRTTGSAACDSHSVRTDAPWLRRSCEARGSSGERL